MLRIYSLIIRMETLEGVINRRDKTFSEVAVPLKEFHVAYTHAIYTLLIKLDLKNDIDNLRTKQVSALLEFLWISIINRLAVLDPEDLRHIQRSLKLILSDFYALESQLK